MHLYFDLDSQSLVSDPRILRPVSRIMLRHGVGNELTVQLVKNRTIVCPTPDATPVFGLKPWELQNSATALVLTGDAPTIDTVAKTYTFEVNYATTELNNAFNSSMWAENTGDGTLKAFSFVPDTYGVSAILKAHSFTVRLDGILQPENSYTIDRATGVIYFATAPDVGANISVTGTVTEVLTSGELFFGVYGQTFVAHFEAQISERVLSGASTPVEELADFVRYSAQSPTSLQQAAARTNLALGTVATKAAPTGTASQLLANNGSGGFANVTLDESLTLVGGVLSAPNATSVIRVCKNVSGGALPAMAPVQVTGGSGDHPEVTVINSVNTHLPNGNGDVFGLLTAAVNDNATERVIREGELLDVDTSAWAEGTDLYVATSGTALTSTPPAAPYEIIKVGIVVRQHASAGIIDVHIERPVHLNDIPGFDIGTLADGDTLVYDSGTGTFVNSPQAALISRNRVYYVETVSGNDLTATAGDPARAYQTVQAAYTAAVSAGVPFTLDIGAGSFTLDLGADFSSLCMLVRGAGAQALPTSTTAATVLTINAARSGEAVNSNGESGYNVAIPAEGLMLNIDTSGQDTREGDGGTYTTGNAGNITISGDCTFEQLVAAAGIQTGTVSGTVNGGNGGTISLFNGVWAVSSANIVAPGATASPGGVDGIDGYLYSDDCNLRYLGSISLGGSTAYLGRTSYINATFTTGGVTVDATAGGNAAY